MGRLRILHQLYLRNGAWGGMEKSFAALIAETRDDPDLAHYLVENLRDPAPPVAKALGALAAPAQELRRWHGLPLPKFPQALRELNRERWARRWKIDRVLNWNQIGDCGPARLAQRIAALPIYWERGAAWFAPPDKPDPAFRACYRRYLANSEASKQMLKQAWRVSGDIQVCTPAIGRVPRERLPRTLPRDRPLRIGFAARLRAFKGGVLAVHALHALIRRGIDAELWIAGDGGDRERMQAQAGRLGLDSRLRFGGWVGDMEQWFDDIDLLLHPALREPYGISCAESLSRGLPVVASCVDGLPEVIEHGRNGLCVIPTLPLSDYAAFGGDARDVYPRVYRPELKRIAAPGVADPEALAAAMAGILQDDVRYAAFSSAALDAGRGKFDWAVHLQRFKRLLGDNGSEARDAATIDRPDALAQKIEG